MGLGLMLVLMLTGCGGSGSKYNEFLPKRIIVIGDEITYVGCASSTSNGQTVCAGTDNYDRFSINSISGSSALTNNWVVQLAANYGLSVSNIIEPLVTGLVTGDDVLTAKKGAIAKGTNTFYTDALSVETQADNIPDYVSGDMVVIAGGANDILFYLLSDPTSTSGVTFQRGMTSTIADQIISDLSLTAITQAQAYYIMAAAQSYQDIALDLINNKGQRNVFLAPVYDFSNSPDLDEIASDFCASVSSSSCSLSSSEVQQGIKLFNYTLRLLTDSNFDPLLFSSGSARILVTSGTTSYDLFYVNIPFFTNVFGSVVNNYSIAKSVCGASAEDLSSSVTGLSATDDLVTNDYDLSYCKWNGTYGGTASFSGDPDFITNSGAYIYTKNQYLTPAVQVVIGNTFSIFMRGYNGW